MGGSMPKPPEDASPFLPKERTLPSLQQAAEGCRGCGLYLHASQTVFGEGSKTARVMFVGEQPGDMEDRQCKPFVGPAGRVFDKALAAAGLERGVAYVTNAVKHFKFEERGKARLHKRPKAGEIKACRPWLQAELDVVRPEVLVLLGATAAQALFGSAFRITSERGKPLTSTLAPFVMATAHPSSILRAPDETARRAAFDALVADLKLVAARLSRPPP
jgi:uracil-DNA glycosylase family protein